MIVFDQVYKAYKDNIILEDISFQIKKGEFVSIVGPSGAGKTTLLKLLLGIEKPSYGIVSVDEMTVSKMNNRLLQLYRRKLGFVFQDYQLIERKTVFENIAFAMEVCGLKTAEIQTRVPEVLKIVNLGNVSQKFPRHLSGGEKQRVAIARALVHHPKVLLADEPTGNLDPINTLEIIKLLVKINNLGTTIILATHDREIINFLRKRTIVIADGKIKSDLQHGVYPRKQNQAELS